MANYEVSRDVLTSYLPHGVELDDYEDKFFVSLVGFMFKQTSLFGIPVPFLGTFEEINLRFYVKRVEGDVIKRGVVFINETVPYKAVAWVANKLYKEHYIAIPTKNTILFSDATKNIRYEWKINSAWNHLVVNAINESSPMATGSMEEFIYEHYYGYTKLDSTRSQEYKVAHARWHVNRVIDHTIDCDFEAMYGQDFSFLKHKPPHSVFVAEGSNVDVKWKRITF